LIESVDIDSIIAEMGYALRHIRTAQCVPMVDLAEMGNMSTDVLSQIERGKREERGLRQLYITAGLLGVRLSDILRYAESCAMEFDAPWPRDGSNSPLVAAVLSTVPTPIFDLPQDELEAFK
jgi:transcriptional regulator with XRE-family HTH domain